MLILKNKIEVRLKQPFYDSRIEQLSKLELSS